MLPERFMAEVRGSVWLEAVVLRSLFDCQPYIKSLIIFHHDEEGRPLRATEDAGQGQPCPQRGSNWILSDLPVIIVAPR